MNQHGVGRLGREYARLRWTLPLWWTATVLVVLACGLVLPRTWMVESVLRFDASGPDTIADAEQVLRRLAAPSAAGELRLERVGAELRVELVASDRPQELRAALPTLVDAFVTERRLAASQVWRDEQQRLKSVLARAEAEDTAARDRLGEALAALPAGGDTTVAARLGRMQAEAQRLALEIRDGNARSAALQARVAELDTELGSMQAEGGGVDTPEQGSAQEQQNQRVEYAALVARRESAREELAHQRSANAAATRRAADLGRLIEESRTELLRLQGENEQIQRLNEAGETAARVVAGAREQLDAHTVRMARESPQLPFTLVASRSEPELVHGLTSGQVVGLAAASGCVVVLLRLLAACMIRHETRNLALLADRLQVRALVELPVWRDSTRDPLATVRRVGSMLVALVGVTACAAYLLLV
ncbi:MAG TPA: hypothetical protein PLN78_01780 [Pseudomonadales bacterium]|nr:hypothetical protein [Pseudomonadales bacterium]HND13684.1 hypothetical protein [Pseudomonadales bacterium]